MMAEWIMTNFDPHADLKIIDVIWYNDYGP